METGKLVMNSDGRWEIMFEDDYSRTLTSGSFCELLIGDCWIGTTIEYGRDGYYSTTFGTILRAGLRAR